MDSATNDNTNMEYLMTGAKFVECLWEIPLGKSEDVEDTSSDIEGTASEPRPSIGCGIDVSRITRQKMHQKWIVLTRKTSSKQEGR